MKSVIKAIVLFIMAFTVVFYGGALLLPGEARVARVAEIAAPPDRVFAIASDLRRVPEWSPWIAVDPATRFTFEGPEQGAGQVMRWASNNPMVGSGTTTLTEMVPDASLAFASDYGSFGKATSSMSFAPSATGTRVTWSFQSPLPGVIDRWAGLMMDRQVGGEYEKALANLKAMAEKQ